MTATVDFYFDFSSPYGYFAADRIEPLAAKHGRTVTWRPVLLGAIFKVSGGQPLPSIPLKGPYSLRDIPRSAAYYGLPYRQPTRFPVATLSAVRAYYWAEARDPARAVSLAKAILSGYFQRDCDISDAKAIVAIGEECGFEAAAMEAGIADPEVKERVKRETDAAIARGVFGSPYLIIDGEPFWGMDRFDQADRWLETGGW